MVVRVLEERLPLLRQGFGIHREPMVLGGDVAAPALLVNTGDVLAAISEEHLLGLCSRSESHQLVAKANPGGDPMVTCLKRRGNG